MTGYEFDQGFFQSSSNDYPSSFPQVSSTSADGGANAGYGLALARVLPFGIENVSPLSFQDPAEPPPPAGAIGYEWENPSAILPLSEVRFPSLPFQTAPLASRSGASGTGAIPSFDWQIRTGSLPQSAVTVSGSTVTGAPGVTSPVQFSTFKSYATPEAAGSYSNFVQEDDVRIAIPGGSTTDQRWLGFSVTTQSVVDGVSLSPYNLTVHVANVRSAQGRFSAPTRYRWLFNEPQPGVDVAPRLRQRQRDEIRQRQVQSKQRSIRQRTYL